MLLGIVIDYPFWFILLCLLAGAASTFILYFRNRKDELPVWLNRLLGVIRFTTISLITFLLLSPLLKSVTRTFEKPVIIFAQDNSQSLIAGKDSLYYMDMYPKVVDNLVSDLRKDFNLSLYTFGDDLQNIEGSYEGLPGLFSEKQTDISGVFDEIQSRYSNRNVGAIIIASDGIYNKGINPLYASEKNRFPVYTIALSDTNIQKDLILAKVNYNRIAYLGNKFPVEVVIRAHKCNGLSSRLDITRNNKMLYSSSVNVAGDNYTGNVILELEAKEKGLQRYSLSLLPLDNEVSTTNNYADIFVDVLEDRQKVLILAAAPHPDITAIKQAVESNFNYDVDDFILADFTDPVSSYNLVILDQLPSKQSGASRVLKELASSKIPVLYILGTESDLTAFNQQNTGLVIDGINDNYNEALPLINPDFVLFNIGSDARKAYEAFPPLISPFGQYKTAPSANILFYQKVGQLPTMMPLVVYNQGQDFKTGVITGEGLWRWRLMDFAMNEQHVAFNEFILKTIQYLSAKEDRGFFRIISQNRFLENEPVEFEAEVYNKNYEPINDPEVDIIITNERNDKFPFVFGRTVQAYHLNAGMFPVGNYSYRATVKVGNDFYERSGQFSVEQINVEKINTVANHNMLFNLAKNHGGQMFFPGQMGEIIKVLNSRQDIKTIIYSQKRYNQLNNILWVLLLITGLLSIEWFIRKLRGSY